MTLTEAIYGRCAIRSYTAEPVDAAQLRALIDAATQAPSAMNRQPWSFRVITDPAVMQRISDAAKTHMLDTASDQLGEFKAILGDPAFHIFYHAPALVVICATESGPWSQIDCALAAENMMLAAFDSGLGSCWIGFAQGWLGTPEGKAVLELPESDIPVAPIIVGRPQGPAATVPRKEADIRWIGQAAVKP